MPPAPRTGSTHGALTPFRDSVAVEVARCLALRPGASMDELAIAAGVSRATLFRRFPSRDALTNELCASAVEAFLAAVSQAEPEVGDAVEAWERVVNRVVQLAPVCGLLGLQPLKDHVEVAVLAQASEGEDAIRQLVRRGQRAGVFRIDVDPEWALTLLTWSTVGVADTVRLGRMTPDAAERHATQTLLAALS